MRRCRHVQSQRNGSGGVPFSSIYLFIYLSLSLSSAFHTSHSDTLIFSLKILLNTWYTVFTVPVTCSHILFLGRDLCRAANRRSQDAAVTLAGKCHVGV